MTPNSLNWIPITWLLGLIGLFDFMGACSWTPQIETELHNSSQGIVSLRTIKDDSLRGDHPVDIKKGTMERVLRGAHKFRDLRLIEGLITDDDKPVRLFSQTQIAFLAPLLISALAQATPEEEIFFQCTSDFEGAPPIKGIILVHDSTLFFTWEEPLSKPNVLAKQHRATTGLPDPSMPQGHTITFFPNEAIRVEDNSTKIFLKHLGENSVAIDYQVLAGLPKAAFEIPGPQIKDSAREVGEQPSTETQTSEEPKKVGSSEDGSGDDLSGAPSNASSDIRVLKEQMEKLQKEVDKQQEELDRLKRDTP